MAVTISYKKNMTNIGISKEQNRNMSLDVLKLIASYVVVFIHFKFSGLTGDIVVALARFAVPVFFMVSGYFAYSNSTEKLISKMKNIIKIYFWGAVIYIGFYGILSLYDVGIKGAMWYCTSYFNPVFIVKFIVFNVPRSSEHLWFLVALIYVYGLHYFVVKWKIKDSVYLWIGVVLLAIHLLLGVGLSSMGIVITPCLIRNFLFMGYPFYCIGMLIRKNEELVHKKITYKRAMILILIGVVETVISYFICGGNELYIGSVLVAVALLIISLKTKDIQINEKIIKLSQTSTGIYLIHIVVGYSIERIVAADMPMVKNIIPVLVCIISTFVVLLSERIKETKQSVVYKS